MRNKMICGMIIFLVIFMTILVSCSKTTSNTETATSSTSVTPSSTAAFVPPTVQTTPSVPTTPVSTQTISTTQANWWAKFGEPKYGGTITVQTTTMAPIFDPDWPLVMGGMMPYWDEHMFVPDWTLDRNTWDFKTGWTPSQYDVGGLVESWEWSNPQTMIAHLRQGIHWQDKAPANGREFTADDVVFHYDRLLGTGDGYTQPHPVLAGWLGTLANVTKVDKYTVQYNFKGPSTVVNFMTATDVSSINMIELPELCAPGPVTSQKGPIADWHNACGTGAWMLTNFVQDTSATLSKNPNYWGHDERYPQNQLPYADTIKMLSIPDTTTAMAALRTDKIDYMTTGLDWHQSGSIKQTNPEIMQSETPQAGMVLQMRCDTKPFSDINVRIALQMSVDRKLIAKNYYGGTVDGTPAGLIPDSYTGWVTPFDQWPQQIQDEYTYNPAKAKTLLANAGYPNGFQTDIVASQTDDIQLLQLVKAEFADVGVSMQINTTDPTSFMGLLSNKKFDQMVTGGWCAFPRPPGIAITDLTSQGGLNGTLNNDAKYDALVASFGSAGSLEDAQNIVKQCDMYVIEHNWAVIICPTANFTVWSPDLKGYSGESIGWIWDFYFSRTWIDK